MEQVQADILAHMQNSPAKYFTQVDIMKATKLPLRQVREAMKVMANDKLVVRQQETGTSVHYFVKDKVFTPPSKIDKVFTKPLVGYTKKLMANIELCMLVRRS